MICRQMHLTEENVQELNRGTGGSSLIQLVITVAVIAIVVSFGLLGINSTRASLHLQNSVRELGGYLVKARLDAIRRHDNASVVFTSTSTYTVTMDFDGSGTISTRTLPFENGVTIVTTPLPTVTFNWRGRTSNCTQTFSVPNIPGERTWVDWSNAG